MKEDKPFYKWFKAAIIRALHTMAQTALGFITVGAAISDVNWGMLFSVSFVAGVASIIKSLAVGLPEVPEGPEGDENN